MHSYDVNSYFSNSSSIHDLDYYSQIKAYVYLFDQDKGREKYKTFVSTGNYLKGMENNLALLKKLNLIDPIIRMDLLPKLSFLIQFEFELLKPFYSKDDDQLYIIDNPISKDFLFKLPILKQSGWKGALKNALTLICKENELNSLNRLLGYIQDNNSKNFNFTGQKGLIYIYPTYFYNIDLEIINPHDRKKRAGTNPILYEVVPANSIGQFSLLYVPSSLKENDIENIQKQVASDIWLLVRGIKAMFLKYGFGAKTSSGFGVSTEKLKNSRLIFKNSHLNLNNSYQETVQLSYDLYCKFLEDDGSLKSIVKGSGNDGLLTNKEYHEIKSKIPNSTFNEFKNFREWFNKYGKMLKSNQHNSSSLKEDSFLSFNNFDELITLTNDIVLSLGGKDNG